MYVRTLTGKEKSILLRVVTGKRRYLYLTSCFSSVLYPRHFTTILLTDSALVSFEFRFSPHDIGALVALEKEKKKRKRK